MHSGSRLAAVAAPFHSSGHKNFVGRRTQEKLCATHSLSVVILARIIESLFKFQDSAQINGIELRDGLDLDGPRLPEDGLKSRQFEDAESVFLDQICKRDSKEM